MEEPSMQIQSQCESQTSPSVADQSTEGSLRDLTLSVTAPNPPLSGGNVLIETDSDESRQKQSSVSGPQATLSKHIGTTPSITASTGRSPEDVYNWRKYGEKHIKGNELSRSYYRCSQQNCQAKKQVVRSKDGQTKEIIYKGEHDHLKPQSSNQTEFRTPLSKEGSDKSPNGHNQASHDTVATPELSPCMTSATERAGAKSEVVVDETKNVDGRESAHDSSGRLDHNESEPSDHAPAQCEPMPLAHSPLATLEIAAAPSGEIDPSIAAQNEQGKPSGDTQGQLESLVVGEPPSAKNETAGTSPQKLSVCVRVPNPLLCAITSRAIVPVGFESDELQPLQVMDPATPSDHKGGFVAAERLSEDGYNWRKYGQKRIIGSEFPRSYYRCTHPNCQVKKQLERSHDGKVTEIIYKGKHDHPKPQPSSRMVVGTVLSIQEDSERAPQLNNTKGKTSDGYGAFSTNTKPNGVCEVSPATNDVVRGEDSQSNEVENEAHSYDIPESKRRCLSKVSNNGSVAHQQSEPSMRIQVYMVTSKADLPAGVQSDERLLREGSDNGIQATQSYHKGSTLIPSDRLPEDVYNWRKYGQKTIKGNEFPRSYYRCTYPNCQVKKQMGQSHDGRIIEIIYKGKHDHPKPLPRGAIVAMQEDRSDMYSSLNSAEGKADNEHGQTPRVIKLVGAHEVSVGMASDDDLEVLGSLSNRTRDEGRIEGGEGEDDDPQSKRRKKDVDALDPAALGKATREPRRVVETLSEVDVLDDGYRWHKYGRKLVKGNPNPRNYYRCSSTGCSVKKHVERASHNPKLVITKYEGKHDHDMPAPKSICLDTSGLIIDSTAPDGTIIARLDENETVSLEAGAGIGSIIESRVIENLEPLDVEHVQDQPNIATPDSSKMVEATVQASYYGSIEGVESRVASIAEVESLSFDTPP